MFIEIENIYNPNMMNFYFDVPDQFKIDVSYADNEEKGEDLTNILQKIDGIRRILLVKGLLFAEKEEHADWTVLIPQIMAELSDYDFKNMSQDILSKAQQRKIIEALIESQIRSFLVRDGGNLRMIDFKEGILYVRLEGHCKGCPHAEMTLKNVVESILKKYLPFVTDVQREFENA